MTRALGYLALVLATLAGVILLWQFRYVVVLFMFALALAAAMRPPIESLARRRVPRGLAVILTYLCGLGLLAAIVYALSNSLVVEGQAAGKGLTKAWTRISTTWPAGSPLQQFIAQQLPQPDQIDQAVLGLLNLQLVQTSLGFTLNLFEVLSQVVLVLVLSIYWSLDRNRFERLWLSMLQAERRIRARTIWQGIEDGVGSHIRSTVTLLVVWGLLLALGYRLLGLDAPVTLAVIAAVIGLIPLMGWVLAVVPAMLVGLIAGPGMAALAALYTLIVFVAVKTLLAPRLLDRRRPNPMFTILVMIVLTDLLGILGLLFAVPLAAVIQIVLGEFFAGSAFTAANAPPSAVPLYMESMAAVQAQLLAAKERLSPTQLSMVDRLTRLGIEAQRVLESKG
jgi:predicted PurR-regulated permease PerM